MFHTVIHGMDTFALRLIKAVALMGDGRIDQRTNTANLGDI